MTPAHHPLIQAIQPWCGWVWSGEVVNWLGVRRPVAYHPTAPQGPEYVSRPGWRRTDRPGFGEEYFEWIALLEAVAAATDLFTMLELGAGYGRWSMNAAALCRRRGVRLRLTAVEAEPTHFRWLEDNFRRNGIPSEARALIRGAVTAQGGDAWFYTGAAAERYGQRLASAPYAAAVPGWHIDQVPAVTLQSLLDQHERVDLIDADLQGVEFDVFASAAPEVFDKVRAVTIGTHHAAAESGLRRLFGDAGWINLADYSAGTPVHDPQYGPGAEYVTHETPYGPITFLDGVQHWVSPALRR